MKEDNISRLPAQQLERYRNHACNDRIYLFHVTDIYLNSVTILDISLNNF